jgi:adenosylmethionine-8-amino-7-oxononanoate aminotransferase
VAERRGARPKDQLEGRSRKDTIDIGATVGTFDVTERVALDFALQLSCERRPMTTRAKIESRGSAPSPASRATRFWHPFSDMSQVAGSEVVLERGQGSWLFDVAGRRYLDATASLWYCNVGHGRAELAEAAATQMRQLAACSNFDRLANKPALALAERIAALAPTPDAAVFFTSGGSESVDTAAKLVRRYWVAVGKPEKHVLVVRDGAYHGMAGYGTSLGGIEPNFTGIGDLLPGVVRLPPHSPAAFGKLLEERGAEVAGFFGEPVIGAGGVHPPAEGYWTEIQRLCRKHDVLLVADEVITGFGRLGEWFGCQRLGIEPDLIVGAKGVTSGYQPLGVVIASPRVQEPFWKGGAGMFRHGYTYSGHPTACAVGLANLAILEREGLVERVRSLEAVLAREVRRLETHPDVGEIRTIGLLAGIELRAEALARKPGLSDAVVAEARGRGVLTRSLVGTSLQVSPPFVIEEAEIRLLVDTLAASIDAVGIEGVPAATPP